MRNECQFVLVRRQHSRQWDGGITRTTDDPSMKSYCIHLIAILLKMLKISIIRDMLQNSTFHIIAISFREQWVQRYALAYLWWHQVGRVTYTYNLSVLTFSAIVPAMDTPVLMIYEPLFRIWDFSVSWICIIPDTPCINIIAWHATMSTLDQVMAWCHQAPSHYLSQRWPRCMSPYGVTTPQCVDVPVFTIAA